MQHGIQILPLDATALVTTPVMLPIDVTCEPVEQWFHVAIVSRDTVKPSQGSVTIGGCFIGQGNLLFTPAVGKGLVEIPFGDVQLFPDGGAYTNAFVPAVTSFYGQAIGGRLGVTSTLNVPTWLYLVSVDRAFQAGPVQ